MLQFEVAPGDQSVYEITTTSGKKYLVRCPGTQSWRTKHDGLLWAPGATIASVHLV